MMLLNGGPPPSPSPPDTEPTIRLTSQDEFETMVGDMRRAFRLWVQKAEKQIRDDVAQLEREQRSFQEEKARVWQEFVTQKQGEYDRIREDGRRAELEVASANRQIRQEREDARTRLQEERAAIEKDVQQG